MKKTHPHSGILWLLMHDQSFLNENVKQLPTAIYTVKMASAD